jgi:uracil phosphoribosyltransferase
LFDIGRQAQHVLVFDGFAATGAQTAAAIRMAENRAATRMTAAAMLI